MSHLTKDQLRSALSGVPEAPALASSATKEELLSAYRQWVEPNTGENLFSDDDEDNRPLKSGKKGRKSVVSHCERLAATP